DRADDGDADGHGVPGAVLSPLAEVDGGAFRGRDPLACTAAPLRHVSPDALPVSAVSADEPDGAHASGEPTDQAWSSPFPPFPAFMEEPWLASPGSQRTPAERRRPQGSGALDQVLGRGWSIRAGRMRWPLRGPGGSAATSAARARTLASRSSKSARSSWVRADMMLRSTARMPG